MSALATTLPPEAVNAKLVATIRTAAVAFAVFLGGFVMREPAPYELFISASIVVWLAFSPKIPRAIMPLIGLLLLFNIGGMIAMTQLPDLGIIPRYLATSLFLAGSAIFFAAIIAAHPELYKVIFRAWVVSAVITALLGVCGYFEVFGPEMFARYGRAEGAFQDPNVFGPYLVPPSIYLLYRIMTERAGRMLLCAIPLLALLAGIFFSFSRGAWGLFIFSSVLLIASLLIKNNSGALRLRIVVMTIAGITVLALGLIVVLQIPGVDTFFMMRAHLAQDYDSARLGRFARYSIGFLLATEKPFGIGALEFGRIYGEDTHDIWLKTLMAYSWLGFACYLTLIVWTLTAGFRILFRERPWQPYLMCAYVMLIGHIGLATIIDIDHWRHVYLLIGMIWAAFALESRHQAGLRDAAGETYAIAARGHPALMAASHG